MTRTSQEDTAGMDAPLPTSLIPHLSAYASSSSSSQHKPVRTSLVAYSLSSEENPTPVTASPQYIPPTTPHYSPSPPQQPYVTSPGLPPLFVPPLPPHISPPPPPPGSPPKKALSPQYEPAEQDAGVDFFTDSDQSTSSYNSTSSSLRRYISRLKKRRNSRSIPTHIERILYKNPQDVSSSIREPLKSVQKKYFDHGKHWNIHYQHGRVPPDQDIIGEMEYYLNEINTKLQENVFPKGAVYHLLNNLDKYTPKQQKRILVQISEVQQRFSDYMRNLDVVYILEQRLQKVQTDINEKINIFTVSDYENEKNKHVQLLKQWEDEIHKQNQDRNRHHTYREQKQIFRYIQDLNILRNEIRFILNGEGIEQNEYNINRVEQTLIPKYIETLKLLKNLPVSSSDLRFYTDYIDTLQDTLQEHKKWIKDKITGRLQNIKVELHDRLHSIDSDPHNSVVYEYINEKLKQFENIIEIWKEHSIMSNVKNRVFYITKYLDYLDMRLTYAQKLQENKHVVDPNYKTYILEFLNRLDVLHKIAPERYEQYTSQLRTRLSELSNIAPEESKRYTHLLNEFTSTTTN